MKNGHNSFDGIELIRWFGDNYECWLCGRNHNNCFHHIVGRSNGDSKCESSILNAAPLNNFQCHLRIHGELRIEENMKKLLQKTIRYLLKREYEFFKIDEEFILKYKKFYD